jgi:hypothetical protein
MTWLTPARVAEIWDAGPLAVLGIDTGDTAAFLLGAWLAEDDGTWARRAALVQAYQCDGRSAPGLARMLMRQYRGLITAAQIEAFDDRPKGHGLKGTNATAIRGQVASLEQVLRDCGIPVHVRGASDVKNWATDARLQAAGLWEVTAGMPRHARDGGRHALYCAVHHCGLPDPLSRRGHARLITPGTHEEATR